MTALYEAVALVVVVALLGFREWRSALLMMLAIPTTLAMTFGMIDVLGIQIQQVSVATLIIALGLLVDDPVVAGDAIKRELAAGRPPLVAAWLGPTRLASAILFATVTNVVAYLPLLLLTGNQGDFLRSLPVVMACALIASRIVSMTFIPLLGYYLLRPSKHPEVSMQERRRHGFTGLYYRVGSFAIEHRWLVLVASHLFLAGGAYWKHQLKDAFFPYDVQYLSTVDVWLRNNAALSGTDAAAAEAERIIQRVAADYARAKSKGGDPISVLDSVTTFVGGGAPRFWFSVTPELNQANYAQLVVRVLDKDDTGALVGPTQAALSAGVPGAIIDVHQLETNPVQYPVAVLISGILPPDQKEAAADIATLRRLAAEAATILRRSPKAARVRDDWGEESLTVQLRIAPDRANLAGLTNQDVAVSSLAAVNGVHLAVLREGDKQIPVIARMRPDERARLGDLRQLYVFATEDRNKLPLGEVASLDYRLQTERIRRQDHARMVTVFGFPQEGTLPSEVFGPVRERIAQLAERMPPGYRLVVAGEEAKTHTGFGQLLRVMGVSGALIYLALVFQFRSAVKPLIVFAAVPYGMAGALAALYITGTPFGYMAFLGLVALIGVIVSHVIVLFDFIEEMRERGEPLREALLDAGIVRLRPVLITVCATVLALVPLAIHGGPLWQPLSFAQIGGLCAATFVTLLLVPVIYAIFTLDLKLVRWEEPSVGPGLAQSTRN
jgi:multidrug efflux pump subunit AcrB